MTKTRSSLAHLSDAELLVEVRRLAEHERHATTHLIASLAELDERRLYLGQGCSSLFTYCTQVLHLSEHAACGHREHEERRQGEPSQPAPSWRNDEKQNTSAAMGCRSAIATARDPRMTRR